MRQIDQEIIEATDELKHDVKLTTAIITGGKTTVVEVSPGNLVRSPKKMIEDCYAETQREIQDRFGSLEQAVGDATKSADECVTLAAQCRSSESTALSSADQAIASATAGERYAGDAAQSKIAAEESASAAAASQQTASSAATASSNAAGASVEAKNDAETAAAECLASKNTAAGSASTATEKAGIATDKATLATRQADRSKAEADRAKAAADGVLKDAVRKPHNLSDLPDKAISRKNLDVYSKAETDSRIDSKDTLPDQTGNNGCLLGTDGTIASWVDPPVALPDQSGADGKFLGSDGSVASWQEVSIPPGVPVGSILPFYGRSAPMGWLGLTRGAKISKADYPALLDLLQRNVRPPLTSFDLNTSDPAFSTTGLYHSNTEKYAIITGQPDNVYRTERIKTSTTNPDTNYICELVPVSGSTPFPNTLVNVTLYHSLTDIPLPNDECFLPDAANNFIKGYEPTGTRPLGTFEQDAIRNITGDFGTNTVEGNTAAFNQASSAGAFACVGNSLNASNIRWVGTTTGTGTNTIRLGSNRIVPTGPENVPRNLNCLWIIKAYDAVLEPEQLQARAVIDQVNGNSSDLLAVNGELDRIGYALLDFGTVNKNSRYVNANPFGNAAVILICQVFDNGNWFETGTVSDYSNTSCVKASQLGSNIVVQTGGYTLTAEANKTCCPVNVARLQSALCRVHVWRVKG